MLGVLLLLGLEGGVVLRQHGPQVVQHLLVVVLPLEESIDAILEQIDELADDDTPSDRKLGRMDRGELRDELERLKIASDDVPY